jgi:hypothetical protein
MPDLAKNTSWLRAIADAANEAQIQLPEFMDRGMGSVICRSAAGGRFVSVKRRFVPASQAVKDGVEWGLWCEQDDESFPVAIFREPLGPTPERVAFMLAVLKGWLLDQWNVEQAESAAATHSNAAVGEGLMSKTGFDAQA